MRRLFIVPIVGLSRAFSERRTTIDAPWRRRTPGVLYEVIGSCRMQVGAPLNDYAETNAGSNGVSMYRFVGPR